MLYKTEAVTILFNGVQTLKFVTQPMTALTPSSLILASVLENEEVKFNRFKKSCSWAVIGASLTSGLFFCIDKPRKTLGRQGER